MHGYGGSTDLLSQTYIYMVECILLVLQALIIVQTNIHHYSKLFTTGQARDNPEQYVIKCVGSR